MRVFVVINHRTGEVLGRHRTAAAAEAALGAELRRVTRFLNRPGLHGGVRADEYMPLGIVIDEHGTL